MDRLIVMIFDSDAKAREGLAVLDALEREDELTVHAKAVIGRDANGRVGIRDAVEDSPRGAATGLALGALVGMLGGPVGLVVGALVGSIGGSVSDLTRDQVDEDFCTEIASALAPGHTAVVASAREPMTLPLDTRVGELGGVVMRRDRGLLDDDGKLEPGAAV